MDLNQVTYGNPTKEHKRFLEEDSLVDDLFLKFKEDFFPPNDSELVKAWFPCKFGNWEAQFAGSDFIRDVRDHLNSKPDKYPKPKNSCSRKWSIREVEHVLSRDGT